MTSFRVVAQPIQHSSFYNGQFLIRWLPLAVKHLKSQKIQTKSSNRILRPFRKTKSKVAVWHRFFFVTRQFDIPCFTMTYFQSDDYPCQRQFLNHTKFKYRKLLGHQKFFQKSLLWGFCVKSFFRCWPDNLTFLVLQ